MDNTVTGYVVCDQDGNNYGPYWGRYAAVDMAEWIKDQGLLCDIIEIQYDPVLV